MDVESRDQGLEELVKNFRDDVFNRTGKRVTSIKVSGFSSNLVPQDENTYSLERLLEVVNEFIPLDVQKKFNIDTIRVHNRNKQLVNLRKVYTKIARDLGYTLNEIARVGYKFADHTTVIHNQNRAEDHLAVQDPEFTILYNEVLQAIEHDLRSNKLQPATESDSEPALPDVILQRQCLSCVYQYPDGVKNTED